MNRSIHIIISELPGDPAKPNHEGISVSLEALGFTEENTLKQPPCGILLPLAKFFRAEGVTDDQGQLYILHAISHCIEKHKAAQEDESKLGEATAPNILDAILDARKELICERLHHLALMEPRHSPGERLISAIKEIVIEELEA